MTTTWGASLAVELEDDRAVSDREVERVAQRAPGVSGPCSSAVDPDFRTRRRRVLQASLPLAARRGLRGARASSVGFVAPRALASAAQPPGGVRLSASARRRQLQLHLAR